ncbi:MAG: MmgE/PrpD family protein [Gammaproteobacteria bacterium]|nr:MmgE/PrpD family protein [Gammaproteobacteria bacterium]
MPHTPSSSPSYALAAFAAGLTPADVPAAAVARAKLHLMDALGIGLAASTYDFARVTARALTDLAEPGTSVVIGMTQRYALRDAMLLNGVLIHGLDYDDTHAASVVHCSASAVPLVVGLGARRGASGLAVLTAYLVALEIDARLGTVAHGTLQKRGWHPTGIIGAFGCAAAAGHLLGASASGITDALGITLSMASGNLEFLHDGAWTKRLHPGWAAVSGLTAATLGRAGFEGPSQPFDGRFGLFSLLLDAAQTYDLAALQTGLGTTWAVFDNAFKPYPACHFVHAFIDCALLAHARADCTPDNIVRIEALIHPDEAPIVCEPAPSKRRPRNLYDAQFSLYYALAATLCHGRFTLAELDPSALRDPATLALVDKVVWQVDAASRYPHSYSGAILIHLRDGRRVEIRQDLNRGHAENPMSQAEVVAKFEDNAGRALPAGRVAALATAVLSLDSAPDLSALNSALVPA